MGSTVSSAIARLHDLLDIYRSFPRLKGEVPKTLELTCHRCIAAEQPGASAQNADVAPEWQNALGYLGGRFCMDSARFIQSC